MTKTYLSLLLFLETCAVDFGGTVDVRHMNIEDMQIAKEWTDSGFVEFRRIPFKAIRQRGAKTRTHFVTLSNDAWVAAHAERRARCQRMRERIAWLQELQAA